MMQLLLGFINFHPYHSINSEHPSKLDPLLEALVAGTVLLTYIEFINLNCSKINLSISF